MITVYDSQFNQNEWFTVILLIVTYIIVFILPKRFPVLIFAIFMLYGVFLGLILDNTIGAPPIDLYDVNDSSVYEFFDILTYIMYGPFSYFVVYFFDAFKLKKQHFLLYVVFWSLVALSCEWAGVQFGVYHYEKGWRLQYSFPSYLAINSLLIFLYYKLCRHNNFSKY